VKGHKIISLTVAPAHVGLPLDVTFKELLNAMQDTGLLRLLEGRSLYFLVQCDEFGKYPSETN
jgi:hypothetical protein